MAREYDTNGYSRIYIYTVNELTAIHEYDGTDEMVYFPVKDHLGQPKSLLAIDETLSQEALWHTFW